MRINFPSEIYTTILNEVNNLIQSLKAETTDDEIRKSQEDAQKPLSDEKIAQICKKLPIYLGATVYPDQKEISIKGCLFSENILGIKIITKLGKESFVPNPYLFTSENENEESIIEGLFIDKSEIVEKSKIDTNFINCVRNDYSENTSVYSTISK